MTKPDEEKTLVVFRRWNGHGTGRDVIALFPCEPFDLTGKLCASYQHIGQHSAADFHFVLNLTTAAKPVEYADLKAELESIGYNLEVWQMSKAKTLP